MAFYDDMATMVAELLADPDTGQDVTVTSQGVPVYDRATGKATAPTVARIGRGLELAYGSREIDGTNVQAGDVRLFMSPLCKDGTPMPAPSPGDSVLLGGVTYRVMRSQPLRPGGVVLAHQAQLRV
ncbi:MAG: hypothetical protein ACYC0T_21310 [Ramlibacter sp.]